MDITKERRDALMDSVTYCCDRFRLWSSKQPDFIFSDDGDRIRWLVCKDGTLCVHLDRCPFCGKQFD